jgi:hypothetical protein
MRQFDGRGIEVGIGGAPEPAAETLEPNQAAGQDDGPLILQQIPPPRDDGHPRAVEHHDLGVARRAPFR